MSVVQKAIWKTLAFFDAQDLPLTLLELRANLLFEEGLAREYSLGELTEAIAAMPELVGYRQGFYFLVGREELVNQRQTAYWMNLRRLRKSKRILRSLRFMPYVRAVAISGSTALLNSRKNSDIDLLVFTEKNRIWLARFFVSALFHILGVRRYGILTKDRFCLNHYLARGTEINTDRNVYTAVEYANLIPVLDEGTLENFWQENAWLKDYLHSPQYQAESVFFGFRFSQWQRIFEKVMDYIIAPLINPLIKHYQSQRIRLQEFVSISDEELSFHPDSKGQQILARFEKRLRQFHMT